jgi:hypothetical protein
MGDKIKDTGGQGDDDGAGRAARLLRETIEKIRTQR